MQATKLPRSLFVRGPIESISTRLGHNRKSVEALRVGYGTVSQNSTPLQEWNIDGVYNARVESQTSSIGDYTKGLLPARPAGRIWHPSVYVDASAVGVGFCLCIPHGLKPLSAYTDRNSLFQNTNTLKVGNCIDYVEHRNFDKSILPISDIEAMSCLWISWKWVGLGRQSIQLPKSNHIDIQLADLLGVELGIHALCSLESISSHIPLFQAMQAAQNLHGVKSKAKTIRKMEMTDTRPGPNYSQSPPTFGSGTTTTIYCDNKSVVTALNGYPGYQLKGPQWKNERSLNIVVKRIVNTCSTLGFKLNIEWVPSRKNLADGPSRGRQVRGTLERSPATSKEIMKNLHVPKYLKDFVTMPVLGVVMLLASRLDADSMRKEKA